MATKPQRVWDEIDASCEREGFARSKFRGELAALPSIMGRKISGGRRNDRKTKVGSSHNQNKLREQKLGFGA